VQGHCFEEIAEAIAKRTRKPGQLLERSCAIAPCYARGVATNTQDLGKAFDKPDYQRPRAELCEEAGYLRFKVPGTLVP